MKIFSYYKSTKTQNLFTEAIFEQSTKFLTLKNFLPYGMHWVYNVPLAIAFNRVSTNSQWNRLLARGNLGPTKRGQKRSGGTIPLGVFWKTYIKQ